MTDGLLLRTSVLTLVAETVLLPFWIWAAMSGADASIQKKIYGSGTAELIVLKKEIEDIMKRVKPHEEFRLLWKGISETIKNRLKNPKRWISSNVIRCTHELLDY